MVRGGAYGLGQGEVRGVGDPGRILEIETNVSKTFVTFFLRLSIMFPELDMNSFYSHK